MTISTKFVWAGLSFTLTLATILTGMTIAEAKTRGKLIENSSSFEKNQSWPVFPVVSLDPCKVRGCVSL
jgi:hypothetical protein